MLTKKRFSVKDMILWTRWETIGFITFATLISLLYNTLELTLRVPWTPVALIGTAVAFIVGFQNNAAYGRIWEARKIWGGIINASRTWGMKINDMISNEYAEIKVSEAELNQEKKSFIYRHIAWLTALRFAMRQSRKWEVFEEHRTNKEWANSIHIPEKITTIEDDLKCVIPKDEIDYIMSKSNKQATLLFLQSKHLKKLKEKGLLWEFSFLELENLLQELFVLQGKTERIKTFPYPRQYATLSHYFVWIFLVFLPFGIIPEFAKLGTSLSENFPTLSPFFAWLAIPFCSIVSWVFHTMQRIGTVGENPFEGTVNDVPISTIARGIEIDLRQMLEETEETIPKQFPEQSDVQM
jgi:putative membrane protein